MNPQTAPRKKKPVRVPGDADSLTPAQRATYEAMLRDPGAPIQRLAVAAGVAGPTVLEHIRALARVGFAHKPARHWIPVVVDGWLPIDTAPKNETMVLLWCPDERCKFVIGAYVPEHSVLTGYWRVMNLNQLVSVIPTMWQPLPHPPKGVR